MALAALVSWGCETAPRAGGGCEKARCRRCGPLVRNSPRAGVERPMLPDGLWSRRIPRVRGGEKHAAPVL